MKSDAIIGAVVGVTKKWAKQRRREERDASATANRSYILLRRRHVSIREASWQVMESAYLKASANGTLPAHARQIMYAARGRIQQMADRPLGQKFDQYFTQQLLPDYIEETGVEWNVVFDARGHFTEPHTEEEVPLGTLQVRDYLRRVAGHEVGETDLTITEKHFPTTGPEHRFGAVLFIEKEGFMPLFKEVKLAERYDLAIMSTKGMSVTASRELVDEICGFHEVPLLVLHDFDKSGFSILGTLSRDTRRYSFRNSVNVIDLGLRIGDIDGLEIEHAQVPEAAVENLRENGATPEEIEFLLHRRVELNAFASDALVTWIERKLVEHGVAKIIPDDKTLAAAYQRAREQAAAQAVIDEAIAEAGKTIVDTKAFDGLRDRIAKAISSDRTVSWDAVLKMIARADHEDAAP